MQQVLSFLVGLLASTITSVPIDFNIFDPVHEGALGKLPHHALPEPGYHGPVNGLDNPLHPPHPVPHEVGPSNEVIPTPILIDEHHQYRPHKRHNFDPGHFVHGYENIPHYPYQPGVIQHHPYPEPHPILGHQEIVHDQIDEHFHQGRLPGDGFGPGGFFSPMPQQKIQLVPVRVPILKPEIYPVDQPYPIKIDRPYPLYLEKRIINPYIPKTAVIKTEVKHKVLPRPIPQYPYLEPHHPQPEPHHTQPVAPYPPLGPQYVPGPHYAQPEPHHGQPNIIETQHTVHLGSENHVPRPALHPVSPRSSGIEYEYVKKKA